MSVTGTSSWRPAGSLTTIFTPPCVGGAVKTYYSSALSSCMPPNYQSYWYGNLGYYSPAICPSGYYIACGRYTTSQGPPVDFDETAMHCAPIGFTCVSTYYSNARSTLGSEEAPMIQIRWRSSDLSLFQTPPLNAITDSTTGTGGIVNTNTGTGGSTTNTGSPDSGSSGSGSNGLSAGAIAGIVIGSVAAISIIALAILMMMRYRHKTLSPAAAPPFVPGQVAPVAPGQLPPGQMPPGQMPPMGQQPYYNPAYGPPPMGAVPGQPMAQPMMGQPVMGQPPMGPPPPTTLFPGGPPPLVAAAAIPGAPTPPPAAYMADKSNGTPSPVVAVAAVSPDQNTSQGTTSPPPTHMELPDHMASTALTQNIPVEMQGWGPGADGPVIAQRTELSSSATSPYVSSVAPTDATGGIGEMDAQRARQLQLAQLDEEEERIRRRRSELQGPSSS